MRILSVALLLILLVSPRAEGATVELTPYRLAAFDSLERAGRYVARTDYDRVRADRGLELRRATYESGGRRVSAIVASPRPQPWRRLPVVLFHRGGYVVGDVGWQYAPLFQDLVRAGFVVVAPMLRGSDGADGHDELGGADLADFTNAVSMAHDLGFADTTRMFLAGESRGGAMVYMALRRGLPARAAAVWGAFTDLDSLMEGDPARYSKMGPVVWPDWTERRGQIAEARSAARWASEIQAPVLILHGGADDEVPLSHPMRLVQGLERAGRSYRLEVIGGQGHTLRGATAERDARIVAWFREYDRRQVR